MPDPEADAKSGITYRGGTRRAGDVVFGQSLFNDSGAELSENSPRLRNWPLLWVGMQLSSIKRRWPTMEANVKLLHRSWQISPYSSGRF